MTVHQALIRANLKYSALDSEIIGTKASLLAREQGVEFGKTWEIPWSKREKKPYLVNDFPASFMPEVFSIIASHFQLTMKPKRKRIPVKK